MTCENCKQDFELRTDRRDQRTRFCKRQCQKTFFNKEERRRIQRVCPCGSQFIGRADKEKCRSCVLNNIRAKASARRRPRTVRPGVCNVCASPTSRFTRKYCSPKCKHIGNPARGRLYSTVEKVCLCGNSFVTSRSERCSACVRKVQRQRSGRRRGESHRQRAIRLGVRYEAVNRVKVFEAAQWRCQICDGETPKELLGDSRDDRAPTLDHVIPLSKGGSHTYDNCQCLCRLCNSRKTDSMTRNPETLPEVLAILVGRRHVKRVMRSLLGKEGKVFDRRGRVIPTDRVVGGPVNVHG